MKKYPFSAQKHAHDIDMAYNACRARITPGGPNDPEDIDRFNRVLDLYTEIIDSSNGKVAWISGKNYALANQIIAWAAERRG